MLFKLDFKSLIFTSFIFMKYPSHYKFSIMDMIFRVTDKAEAVLLVSQKLVLDPQKAFCRLSSDIQAGPHSGNRIVSTNKGLYPG